MLLIHNSAGLGTADNGILEWLDQHGGCHPRVLNVCLGGIPGFSLHTDDAVGSELRFDRQNKGPFQSQECKGDSNAF